MIEQNKIIRPGDLIVASLPGIACDFQGEIVEIQKLGHDRARVCLKALEPVIPYSGKDEVLYETGSYIWLTMSPPDGYVFGEKPDTSPFPPIVGHLDE